MDYIHVENLCKQFQIRRKREKGSLVREKQVLHALQNVCFDIGRGELVGYIGPNGAGKSTTVKILSGILTPESGTVLVGGQVPWKNRKTYVRRIGVVFGQRMQLWWDVPIVDSFLLLKDIYRLPEEAYRKRLDELTQALDLGDLLRVPLRQLSLGQRMRAELCGSLLHQPELLFLDEPTIGLDAVSTLALRDFLRWENREHRTTILLTTHDMEDVAALCSRVMVLGHGSKLYDGALSGLLEKYDRARTVTVEYEGEADLSLFPPDTLVHREGARIRVSWLQDRAETAPLLARLQKAGTVREMTIQPENIDQMIAKMYQEMGL